MFQRVPYCLAAAVAGLVLNPFVTPAVAQDDFGATSFVPGGLPAVSGFNGKIAPFAGSMAEEGAVGVRGALSVPLGFRFGAQVDGTVGSLDGDGFSAVAGHLFWRDPTIGLLGLYGSYNHLDRDGGVDVSQWAVEFARYWGRYTIKGVLGWEHSDADSSRFTFDDGTRFFDEVDVSYYVTDNWDVYVGHRYLGGDHAAAFGTEWAGDFGLGYDNSTSLFVEARLGEDDFNGIWGGVKFYFGAEPKSLIRRHREDDPDIYDSPFSAANVSGSRTPVTGGGGGGEEEDDDDPT